MSCSTRGYWTFTAATWPSRRTAMWTWPRLAAATARASMRAKSASIGLPSSASMTAWISLKGRGGTRSCKPSSSLRKPSGRKLARTLTI